MTQEQVNSDAGLPYITGDDDDTRRRRSQSSLRSLSRRRRCPSAVSDRVPAKGTAAAAGPCDGFVGPSGVLSVEREKNA
jgi:hypothetical protein